MVFTSTLAAPIVLAMAAACPTPPPTTISVQPTAEQPHIDNTVSKYKLDNFDISTVSPYSHDRTTEVNGLMRGKAEIETNVSVSWRTNKITGEGCFWYKSIDVNIKLAPTIYIAKHIKPDTCMYGEVLEHELKHVNVDRELSNKYVHLFEQNIRNFTRQNREVMPHPAYEAEQIKDKMVAALDKEITRLNGLMQDERLARQARIDTLEEYERVARACIGKR